MGYAQLNIRVFLLGLYYVETPINGSWGRAIKSVLSEQHISMQSESSPAPKNVALP